VAGKDVTFRVNCNLFSHVRFTPHHGTFVAYMKKHGFNAVCCGGNPSTLISVV
jgi:hypothetical protein